MLCELALSFLRGSEVEEAVLGGGAVDFGVDVWDG